MRAAVATAFVALLCAGAIVVPRLADFAHAPSSPDGGLSDRTIAETSPSGFVDQAFARLSGSTLRPEGVPGDFTAEACDVGALNPVQVQGQGGVVGVVSPLGEEEARAIVRGQFADHGWHKVAGAGSQGRGDTFERAEGPYRWAFASCRVVAGGTCVVIAVEERL